MKFLIPIVSLAFSFSVAVADSSPEGKCQDVTFHDFCAKQARLVEECSNKNMDFELLEYCAQKGGIFNSDLQDAMVKNSTNNLTYQLSLAAIYSKPEEFQLRTQDEEARQLVTKIFEKVKPTDPQVQKAIVEGLRTETRYSVENLLGHLVITDKSVKIALIEVLRYSHPYSQICAQELLSKMDLQDREVRLALKKVVKEMPLTMPSYLTYETSAYIKYAGAVQASSLLERK